MLKSVIQVPIDKELLARLDQRAAQKEISRAALIRQACTRYLRELEREEKIAQYVEGYRRFPETDRDVGETMAWLAAAELPAEEWPEAPKRDT
jgi:metal-responsive CopG/Arc/MetJ family transcriptional regulator